jgi:signal transduction histidine kinase
MTPMDGFEVCKILKEDSKTKDIPIIFLSAKNDNSSIVKAFALGGVDYIAKPFNEAELLARVDTHMQLRQYYIQRSEQEKMDLQQLKIASMSELLANIAHQWRQPLNHLALSKDLLMVHYEDDKLTNEVFYDTTSKMGKTIQGLSDTIDSFRDYFISTDGIIEFDILSSIEDTYSLLKNRIETNKIKCTLSGDRIIANLNIGEFRQIIMNLLMNSVDAIEKNKINNPSIDIELKKIGNLNKIIIIDTGGGIKDKILDKIFEPYFSTKFHSKGVGLGLYTSKQILESCMKGNLEIENYQNGVKTIITLRD